MRIQGKVITVAGLMISISMNLFAQEPGRNRQQPPSGTMQRKTPASSSPRVVQGNSIGTSIVGKPNTTRQQQAPAAASSPQANSGNSSNLMINSQNGNDNAIRLEDILISSFAGRSYTGTTTINAGTLKTSTTDNGKGHDKTTKRGPGTVQAGLEGDPSHPVVVGSVYNSVQENSVAGSNGGVWKTDDIREKPANSLAVDPSDPTGSTGLRLRP